jgi:small subunit ribosomal protein S8
MVDPITDLLNRLGNAARARHVSTRMPFSKIKVKIVEILKQEGYIDDFSLDDGDGIHRDIIVYPRYVDDFNTAIHEMRRVSTPGRRFYCRARDISRVKSGLGVAIISTPKGIMTDRDATKQNQGGEVLCEIW